MRQAMWLVTVSLLLTGCAATADFVDLTRAVADVRNQQNALKAQIAELKQFTIDIMAQQEKEHPKHIGSRLDELNTTLEAMATVQSRLDLAFTELQREHEDRMRRIAAVSAVVGSERSSSGVTGTAETDSNSEGSTVLCLPSDMPMIEPDIQPFIPTGDETEDQMELSPREAFEVAYQDYQAGDYDTAIQGFEGFQRQFPDASLAVDAQYLVGTAYFRKHDCGRAIAAYENMINKFPHHKNNALGLLKLSYLYDAVGNKARARSVLLRLIDHHPRSKEAKLARQRLPDVSQ